MEYQQPVPLPPQYQPTYPQMGAPRVKYENFAMIMIIVGTILIGVGIIVLGVIPGDIYIKAGGYSGNEYHPDIKITSLTVGCILAGIGTMINGLGAALNIKAYFEQQERLHTK